MRRLAVPLVPSFALVLMALLATPRVSPSMAQQTTPTTEMSHPVVGAWILDTDASTGENAPSLASFSSDGVYHEVSSDGPDGIGVWQPIDADSVALTITYIDVDPDGTYSSTTTVRATVDVDSSGNAFTAQYTLEFVDPQGGSSGQLGPGTATATRMTVEPMGTPVSSLEAAFAAMEGATPTP